ncbi:MAG: hypothetical protein EOO09_14815 [Chitinophagaceae bacterium]|nr:MAG: hypothetical protein EOO09_14815 [Chitinophagaceae bacterium]
MYHLIFLMLSLFFSACEPDSADCKSFFKEGSRQLNLYYQSKQERHLDSSLIYFNNAIQCDNFKAAAIEQKIGILILLKDFSKASQFVDSLESNVFLKPYTKEMYLSMLNGYKSAARGDSVGYRMQIKSAVQLLEKFIKLSPDKKKVDQQAYYDLFFLTSKIYPKLEIQNEADRLAGLYPSDADFFNSLKNTFFEN